MKQATTAQAVALISNPLSYTNRRRGSAALHQLEQQVTAAGGSCWQATDGQQLNAAVTAALAQGCALLIANGGDGTIHGVVSEVLRQHRDDVMVAVLPGGRTNVIAADLGMRGRSEPLLKVLLASWQRTANCSRRPTLKVAATGEPERYGFLVNGAGLARLIERCWQFRERYRGWGLYGGFGTGIWVVGRLGAALLGSRLFKACAARLYWQSPEQQASPWSDSLAAFSVTTNAHLPLGISPYATDDGRQENQQAPLSAHAGEQTPSGQAQNITVNSLKATAIAGDARRIGWRLISGLLGNGRRFSHTPGFISGLPGQIRIEALEPLSYHLDGERYLLAAGHNLTISRGPVLRLYQHVANPPA